MKRHVVTEGTTVLGGGFFLAEDSLVYGALHRRRHYGDLRTALGRGVPASRADGSGPTGRIPDASSAFVRHRSDGVPLVIIHSVG